MSGIISPFGRTGRILEDIGGRSIRAYCYINSDSPSSSAFERSYNVASISYATTSVTLNFIEPIVAPYGMYNVYGWSTGSYYRVLTSASTTGLQTGITWSYRKINNSGNTSVDANYLNSAILAVYGGME